MPSADQTKRFCLCQLKLGTLRVLPDTTVEWQGKQLQPKLHKNAWRLVICTRSVQHRILLKKLVWLAFFGDLSAKQVVVTKDGTEDFRPENLCLSTIREQAQQRHNFKYQKLTERAAEILADYQKRVSVRELAKTNGVSEATIYRLFKDHGRPTKCLSSKHTQIQQERAAGLSVVKIAAKYGISRQRVYHILEKASHAKRTTS